MTLNKDQPQSIGSYQLVFRGINEFPVENATHRAANVEVLDQNGNRLQFLNPAKSFYPTQPQPLTEVGIRRSFWEDLYIIFSSENGELGNSVTLRVFINPLVGWAWMALPVFTLGIAICFLHRPNRLVARETVLKERFKTAEQSMLAS